MKKKTKEITFISFEKHLAQEMKNKEFKKAFEEEGRRLEIAYKIFQLRKRKKLSQKELARKLDTTQSVVARIEAGQQNFSIDTLEKIADALDSRLNISFAK